MRLTTQISVLIKTLCLSEQSDPILPNLSDGEDITGAEKSTFRQCGVYLKSRVPLRKFVLK